jgi:5'-deoxynucleotidase YfbR-like HD superfamily hydrolase
MENSKLLSLFHNAGKLKCTKRAGWVRAGITDSESVADHSFRCTFIAMVLGDEFHVDSEKLLKIAVIHDLAECVVGDITPHDGISQEEKKEKEHTACKEIFKDIPNSQIYLNLWTEYEKQNSPEAILIKNIDKLEMALTALEYQKENPKSDLAEFVDVAESHIDDPKIKQIFWEIKKQGKATLQ